MKRVISLLLTTVMILMLIPVNVFAAEQVATLEVTSSKDNAQRGEEVVFTVSLKATDVVSAIGVSVKLPEGLTYTSYSMDKESLVEKTGADGDVSFTVDSLYFMMNTSALEGLSNVNDITLFSVTCTVADDAEYTALTVELVNVEICNADADPYDAEVYSLVPATVTVTKAPCTTHNWGEWVETKAPTCEEAGEETRTCPDCSATETRPVEPTGHAWDDEGWTETKAPTCEEAGEETRECLNKCGKTETRPVEPTGHNWGEWEDTTDAECGKPGVQTRTCLNKCGTTETRETDALEHAWGEWEVTTAPTCEGEGVETRTCTREGCGATETRPVEPTGHAWDDEGWTETTAPTCEEAGVETRECLNKCGETQTRPVEPTGHNWGEWEDTTDAACGEPGVQTRTCLNKCGTTETRETDALEHAWGEWEVTTAPTCEGEGEETRRCTREGCAVTETRPVKPTGHNWGEWEDTTDAECGKPGVQTRTCLNECGTTETRETDALEHAWGEWEETTTPGCEDEGEETRYCTREGCEVSETRAVKALGHDFSEWTASADATCGEPGEEMRTCLRQCGKVETRETDALGHLWGEWVVTKEATCTEPGEKVRTCQRPLPMPCSTSVEGEDGRPVCGETETAEIPALGHAWGEWVETKAPTEDEEGEERRDCTRCDAYETRALEALGNSFMDEWYWTMIMLYNKTIEIEADASKGGEIDPEGVTKVNFARDMEYTITPDEGYEIEAVYVDGENIGAVDTYTFKRVTQDHTIYAVFAEVDETEAPVIEDSIYDDVDADDWFYEDVVYVTENGLMNGTGDNKFSPEVNTTRAMIVTILWRLEGEADAESAGFTDVADDMWYTEAIDWAAANGIVLGYGDGTFGPEKNITREQVMAILHRYAAYKGWDNGVAVSMLAQYDCSVWAENDVNWADMCGILDNLGVDVTDMTAEADRAEIAAYFTRFCQNIAE